MKKIVTITGLSLLATVTIDAEARKSAPAPMPVATQLLQYVIRAETGQVSVDPQLGLYQLTLSGVDNKVVTFPNRPERSMQEIPMERFLTTWSANSFNKMPPNAVVIFANGKQSQQGVAAFAIMSPVFNANQHTLQFTIKALNTGPTFMTAKITKPVITFTENTI